MTAVLLLCLIFNYKFMKKKSECLGIYHYRWQKIGKIMKLCIILVCLFSFSLSATTLAQRERVNMKLQDVSLRQVLEQIREQTNLQFMMSKEQGERVGRVSVDAVNETVVEVLDKIFASTGLTWVVKEDIIVVKERPQQQMRNPARVKGVVKDQKGHPLPGVTVLIKGTALGVVTDADGNYSLELPGAQGVRLIFSFIGMKTQEMAYTGQAELNIVMQEDITEMDEVVVTGYQNIKKENATGSYQTITSKELERRYSTDIISSLEGMLSGLVSYNKGLNDDAESNIMIRGVSTFTDRTKPLVVVDGLPIEGSIETINPYDISSITVLKMPLQPPFMVYVHPTVSLLLLPNVRRMTGWKLISIWTLLLMKNSNTTITAGQMLHRLLNWKKNPMRLRCRIRCIVNIYRCMSICIRAVLIRFFPCWCKEMQVH